MRIEPSQQAIPSTWRYLLNIFHFRIDPLIPFDPFAQVLISGEHQVIREHIAIAVAHHLKVIFGIRLEVTRPVFFP